MTDPTLILILWIVCAVGAYLIASSKGDPNPGTWGLAGLLLGPLGLLLAAMMAKPPKHGERICVRCGRGVAPDRERLCDNCGEPFAA